MGNEIVNDIAKRLNSFRNASLRAYRDKQTMPSVYPIAEDIANLLNGTNPKQKLPPKIKNGVADVFKELNALRGYNPPKRSAEASAIARMLKKGYTVDQIIDVWKKLKADNFWQNKELFMMTVENQIGAIQKVSPITKYKHQKHAHLIQGLNNDPDKYIQGKYGHLVQR